MRWIAGYAPWRIVMGFLVLLGLFTGCPQPPTEEPAPVQTFVISFGVTGGHGAIKAELDGAAIQSGARVEKNKTLVFTALPDPGFVVDSWTTALADPGDPNTARLLASAAATVSVSFRSQPAPVQTFVISFGVTGGHGAIKAELDGAAIQSGARVEKNKTLVFTALPDPGFVVDSWTTALADPGDPNTARLLASAAATVSVSFKSSGPATGVLNTNKPAATVKIVFIHHSTGEAWIKTDVGNLGKALNANNYFVSETDYGWNAEPGDGLGNRTDTVNWPEWFTDAKMPYVYANTHHEDYTNTISDPSGENSIVMFKSCYPNSEVGESIEDEKALYRGLLTYFAAHTDKMFVLVIPPPEQTIDSAPLTRELSNWLVDRKTGWLSSYAHKNVYAFNYYNVLTHPDNHHWVNADGKEENLIGNASNTLHYYNNGWDDHPTSEGHQKATAEFLPLLNGWYNTWQGL